MHCGKKASDYCRQSDCWVNQHLNSSVLTKLIHRELYKAEYHGRAVIRKTLLFTINIQQRLKWCINHKGWSTDQWKQVIFSDESSFSLFLNAGRDYVWRQPSESCNPDCLLPTVKHVGGSIMVWAAISWSSLSSIVGLHSRINSIDSLNILGDQVHPIVYALFFDTDDNAPIHTAHVVKNWYKEHESKIEHVDWPPQSPDLNIIEHLSCILERQVRNRYPPPPCLKELEQVLMEEWLKIPLDEVRKLYVSIPRRIEAELKAGGGSTPY